MQRRSVQTQTTTQASFNSKKKLLELGFARQNNHDAAKYHPQNVPADEADDGCAGTLTAPLPCSFKRLTMFAFAEGGAEWYVIRFWLRGQEHLQDIIHSIGIWDRSKMDIG